MAYEIAVRRSIERGLADAEAGRLTDITGVRREFGLYECRVYRRGQGQTSGYLYLHRAGLTLPQATIERIIHCAHMSATTLVEIVDDAGRPCPVGVRGRVLLTSLHSYAMPILRYEVGALATWGPACDCGIQTPVIERILGRTRYLVSLPNGSRRFVSFTDEPFTAIAPVREHQVILYTDKRDVWTYRTDDVCGMRRDLVLPGRQV